MIVATKQLLFNMAILIILLFSIQSIQRQKNTRPSYKFIFFYYTLSVLVSLILSVKINEDIHLDLRQIPLLLGALYLGPIPGLFLLVVLMVIRSFFGIDHGFWISFSVYGLQLLLVLKMHSWFLKQNAEKKVEATLLLSLLSSIIFILITYFVKHSIGAGEWIVYILVSTAGAGMMTGIIESEKMHFLLKEKVMQAQKVEVISQMCASISHEVRNPLATVKGFLQLLKDPSFNEKKKNDFIDIAQLELDRAEKIINDFLSLAKPAINVIEEIDLVKELKYIIKVVQPMANMNSIEINSSFEQDAWILGDKQQFHQCFLNLLKNSIEAMPQGGQLNIHLYLDRSDAFIHIIDNGIGMTSEHITRLGEPFFSTKGDKGTGLGIMFSFSAIRAMKGDIQVNSKINEGTSFIISFPILEETGDEGDVSKQFERQETKII